MLKERLAAYEKDPEGEETKMAEDQLAKLKELISDGATEIQELTKLLAEEKEKMKEKNPFADFIEKAFADEIFNEDENEEAAPETTTTTTTEDEQQIEL